MKSEAALAELMGRMRSLEADHTPDGWPAVQMRDITALCDAIVARSEIGALDLLARIREALGDNGTRMQDELLEYCRELRDAMVLAKKGSDDAAYFERLYKSADEVHSYMVGQNNSLTRRVAELEAQLGLVSDEVLDELGRYRAALETISDPSTASMTHAGTVDTLRSHARRALKP